MLWRIAQRHAITISINIGLFFRGFSYDFLLVNLVFIFITFLKDFFLNFLPKNLYLFYNKFNVEVYKKELFNNLIFSTPPLLILYIITINIIIKALYLFMKIIINLIIF